MHKPRFPSSTTLRALWRHFESDQPLRLAKQLCELARKGTEQVLDLFSDHPLGDEWRDFALQSMKSYVEHRKGWVYVVVNPIRADLYKVGETRFDVAHRIKSLKTAGVIGSFVPVAEVFALDRFAVEAAAHNKLALQCQRHKEFFQTDFRTAVRAVEESAQEDNRIFAVAGIDLPSAASSPETLLM